MFIFLFFIIVSAHNCGCRLPATVSPAIVRGTASGVCPSAEMIDAQKNATKQEILDLLRNTVNPALSNRYRPPCSCSGLGEWTRIAFLNMTDPNQQCPPNWSRWISPVRACGRSTDGPRRFVGSCDSAIFPSNGRSYSHVCGRLIGYQKGSTDAFEPSILRNPGLEGPYLDGVSLTHGAAGSRQHIWSFPSALYETDPNYRTLWNCPCTNTNINWPHQVPSFIGNNYFCDTASTGPGFVHTIVYSNDPLWDGQGCGPSNACCQFNNPPWFCTILPQPTNDDIELRICANNPRGDDEDTLVNLIDIYVM